MGAPNRNNNKKSAASGQKPGPGKDGAGSKSNSNADLYDEASKIMKTLTQKGTSGGLRSIIYNHKTNKSDPRQLYALVSSTLKFREILTAVIKASGILKAEKRAFGGSDVNLALLMAHDLLLSRSGRITSRKSLAKDAILKHKTRLKAELVKYKVKHKIHDINTLITEKDESKYTVKLVFFCFSVIAIASSADMAIFQLLLDGFASTQFLSRIPQRLNPGFSLLLPW
jgi:putative methyltransferase